MPEPITVGEAPRHLRTLVFQMFVHLLVRRIEEDHARAMAAGLLEDMGYDDCPVCLANRQREAWGRRRPSRG